MLKWKFKFLHLTLKEEKEKTHHYPKRPVSFRILIILWQSLWHVKEEDYRITRLLNLHLPNQIDIVLGFLIC